MKIIRISDITVSACPEAFGRSLTFKEKLDTVRLLDKAGVSVIELGQMTGQLTDTLLIKSVTAPWRCAREMIPTPSPPSGRR